MMEAYKEKTRTYLWNLHSPRPSSQPRFSINCTISGIPNSMMRKSARAKFMMNRFVTERLIFLSASTTKMTSALPRRPTLPMTQKRMDRQTRASRDAAGGGDPEGTPWTVSGGLVLTLFPNVPLRSRSKSQVLVVFVAIL